MDLAARGRLPERMNHATRDRIDELGSRLSKTMEDASASAATMPAISSNALVAVMTELGRATDECQALIQEMRVLMLADQR